MLAATSATLLSRCRCARLRPVTGRAVALAMHSNTGVSRGMAGRARSVGDREQEVVALGRLARTNASRFRVVFQHSNRNVKAAIVDDRRNLTVRMRNSRLASCARHLCHATFAAACSSYPIFSVASAARAPWARRTVYGYLKGLLDTVLHNARLSCLLT